MKFRIYIKVHFIYKKIQQEGTIIIFAIYRDEPNCFQQRHL